VPGSLFGYKKMKIDPCFCFDLDGTLLDEDGRIHPNDINLLSKFEDFKFVVTTGRSRESVRRSFNTNGLFINSIIPIPMVLLNGSLIYASNERFISYHPFTPDIQSELLKTINQFTDITFLLLDVDNIHIINPTQFGMQACTNFEFITTPFSGEDASLSLSKLMCISPAIVELDEFSTLLSELPIEIAMSMDYVMEITPSGINKAFGLQQLISDSQIENRNIIAAGDGGNDVPLFNLAYLSFVPENAPVHIKGYADLLINRSESGILSPMIHSINKIEG
jgi:Cof subfamily protein (haloacid dehalogenase superfamily)